MQTVEALDEQPCLRIIYEYQISIDCLLLKYRIRHNPTLVFDTLKVAHSIDRVTAWPYFPYSTRSAATPYLPMQHECLRQQQQGIRFDNKRRFSTRRLRAVLPHAALLTLTFRR